MTGHMTEKATLRLIDSEIVSRIDGETDRVRAYGKNSSNDMSWYRRPAKPKPLRDGVARGILKKILFLG